MTAAGWCIMIVSVGGVAAAYGYCLFRVLTLPSHEAEEHVHSRIEIDAEERDDSM